MTVQQQMWQYQHELQRELELTKMQGIACPVPSPLVVARIKKQFLRDPNEDKNKEEAVRLLMGLYKHNGALRTHLCPILVLLGKELWEL